MSVRGHRGGAVAGPAAESEGVAVVSVGNGDNHSHMQMSFILREQIASLLSL